MDLHELQIRYSEIKARAAQLAGPLEDIPRRVTVLYNLYLDSGRNHAFSQIAAHGALWAYGYFEVGGRLGRLVANRYFYSAKEKAFRLGILQRFAEGFRDVNRYVCIDTFTNYHFVKQYGREPQADQIVSPALLDALNRVHAAREAGRSLDEAEKKHIFEQSFFYEQEVTVAPGVKTAVDGFECPIMKFLCLRPVVRFSFFPGMKYMVFKDFSAKEERIEKGFRAYDIAARAGWDKVRDSMRAYRLMQDEFFAAPDRQMAVIERELAGA